jgi:hypothetical protein
MRYFFGAKSWLLELDCVGRRMVMNGRLAA